MVHIALKNKNINNAFVHPNLSQIKLKNTL